MKVSIVHPERRTLQSIALEAPQLPKKLRPATRHELAIARGSALEFIAGIGGSKKLGAVPLVIELEAEEGETIPPGCLCYAPVPANVTDGVLPKVEAQPARECRSAYGVQIMLQPGQEIGVVIANLVPASISPADLQSVLAELGGRPASADGESQ